MLLRQRREKWSFALGKIPTPNLNPSPNPNQWHLRNRSRPNKCSPKQLHRKAVIKPRLRPAISLRNKVIRLRNKVIKLLKAVIRCHHRDILPKAVIKLRLKAIKYHPRVISLLKAAIINNPKDIGLNRGLRSSREGNPRRRKTVPAASLLL